MRTLCLLLVALLPSVASADPIPLGDVTFHGVTFEGQQLEMTTMTMGLTPLSASTTGRLSYSGLEQGLYNKFVFWVAADDQSGQPFTVLEDGRIQFRLGDYEHYSDGVLNGLLRIVQSENPDEYVFLFDRGQAAMALPSLVMPRAEGSSYYIDNVPTMLNKVPSVPEPSALPLFGLGLVGLGVLGWLLRRKMATQDASLGPPESSDPDR